MYYVYILVNNKNDQVYIGSTSNIKRRLKEHNNGQEISTKKYMPWKLEYYEAYKTEELARAREKRLKQHGNAKRELKKRVGLSADKSGNGVGLSSTIFKRLKSGAGFTLIELIIVIGVIGVVAVLSVPFIQTFQPSSDLYTHTDSITKTLRLARQQAINGQNSSAWGVYFDNDNNSFILFKGDDYSSRDTEYDLEAGYGEIFNISTNFSDEIIFSLYSGDPSNQGTVTITNFNNNESEIITITVLGLIEINE